MNNVTRWATAITLVLGALGCEKTSVEGASGKKLTLLQPASQTLKRGETNQIAITVARSNFADPVAVKFSNLPKGTTVVEDKKIDADKNIGTYTLHSGPDADLVTNHVAKVTVEGPGGMTATESFQITVKDKN
ncbi:MAG: hypothetical protein FD180_2741 [Planctomycetota bacterium]|nr:MAG: hypothetical protein FD180_2741 [Planctomycetota bacterium]